MRRSEKILLNNLESDTMTSEVPLKNIKEGLGSIAYITGNPKTKTEITLNVRINYFLNQQPIAPAALPANLQLPQPVPILGLTDFYAGYPKLKNLINVNPPWLDNLNYSYREGAELVDQNVVTGWGNAVYWNVIPGNFGFGGAFITDVGVGMGNVLIRNNFFTPGHVYHIKYAAQDVLAAGGYEQMIFDGVNLGIYETPYGILPLAPNVLGEIQEYYYMATAAPLQIVSGTALGQQINIIGLSIKEIFGHLSYPSDNTLGIFGYNKSFCLSQGVENGDLVQSINFIDRNAIMFGNPHVDLYTAEIIVHCENVAYGTFLNSFVSDLITIDTIRYIVPIANINQFLNPLIFGYQTLFGKFKTDNIDPRMFISSRDFQQQIADVPLNLPIDKSLIIGTHIDFNCPRFDLILFVDKVEPLTYRRKK